MKTNKILSMVMVLMAACAAFGVDYDPAKHGDPIEILGDEAVEIDGHGVTIDAKGKSRCATLGPNVTLRNFVLKNGFAELGGGVYGGRIADCKITGCRATESAAALCNSVAENCTITGNAFDNGNFAAAAHGGILFGSTLTGCTIGGNTVTFGSEAPAFGGIGEQVTLTGCTISNNTVTADERICYGLRFAYSTLDGKEVEFDDADASTPPTPPDPPGPPDPPDPPDPPGPFDPWMAFENIYFKATLQELGATTVPTNRKITIKAEGLPKGLKLVTTALKDGKNKATGFYAYTVEGVPTELMDGTGRIAYVRVTDNKVQTLYALRLVVRPAAEYETKAFPDGTNKTAYANYSVTWLWYDVAKNPKNCTLNGLPSGIRYATKDNRDAKAYEIYGKPTKAGRFTVKAVEKIPGTSYKSTHVATLTVWPEDLEPEAEWTDRAYDGVYRASGADVTAASGLPTGIRFTARDIVSRGEVTTAAHHFYGTPTKAGTYAVTLTYEDMSKTGFLWTITPAEAPSFELRLTETKVEPLTKKATVRVGVAYDWTIYCTSNATVSASGLPTGLKLVKTAVKADKKTVGYTYSVAGVPTKAGEFFTTFTTKLNGVSTVTTAAFVVLDLPAWAQGTFDGGADETFPVGGQVTFTVSKVGKLSGKWMSEGTNWTLSATSYDRYDEATGSYVAQMVGKTGSGKKAVVFTNETFVTADALGGVATNGLFLAYQNNWKVVDKSVCKSVAQAPVFEFKPYADAGDDHTNDVIALKFAASGKVTVKASYFKSASAAGKISWTTASGSAVLCPQTLPGEGDTFLATVFVYLPPKKNTPTAEAAYAVCIRLKWDGEEFKWPEPE